MMSIKTIFKWLLPSCMKFLRKKCEEFSPTMDSNLVVSFMNIFDALISFNFAKDEEYVGKYILIFRNILIFSLFWLFKIKIRGGR